MTSNIAAIPSPGMDATAIVGNATVGAACIPSTFSSLSLPGVSIATVEANILTINKDVLTGLLGEPKAHVDVTFCNLTVGYTHPGFDDLIHVEAWLPAADEWNERLLGVGGGGFAAGRDPNISYDWLMAPAVQGGFAAVTTDSGVHDQGGSWAHLNPGNPNLVGLHNFAGRSLQEKALLGQQAMLAYYGRRHKRAYFAGCSQGGRQGMTIAQRYPDLYDGIWAAAPASSITAIGPNIHWPQQFMAQAGIYPLACEIDAITKAAIEACDGLDGIEDGIVAEWEKCLDTFDPFTVVGKTVECKDTPDGKKLEVSKGAAEVVEAVWKGPHGLNGDILWGRTTPGTDLTGNGFGAVSPGRSIANTQCIDRRCKGEPTRLGMNWMRAFLARDMDLDVYKVPADEFLRLVEFGRQELKYMDADEPDLRAFQRRGGKLVTYHGSDDNLIPIDGILRYYDRVKAVSPDVRDFYRIFEAPGLAHCFGGRAGIPGALLGQLQAWVEEGTAPDTTKYEVLPKDGGGIQTRLLCAVPQKAVFDQGCGEAGDVKCWSCV